MQLSRYTKKFRAQIDIILRTKLSHRRTVSSGLVVVNVYHNVLYFNRNNFVVQFIMSQSLRKRGTKKLNVSNVTNQEDDFELEKTPVSYKNSEKAHYIGLVIVTLLAAYTRFTKLGTPSRVVFDEVHFGKFASYYLERTYFFDLHPPFAKLLFTLVGYLIGYDGKFKFDNINDLYIDNDVPYVAFRSLLAILGVAIIPVMYLTMKTLKFSVPACVLSCLLVCFDNAQIIESRLILLDATLIFSVALSIFTYVKFTTYRNKPYSKQWWLWLYATGISLSCVISTKYVGVFTYVTIGIGILYELWYLLDYDRGLSLGDFAKHFFARLWALIVVPFIIYLFWFYLHFAILTKSGPGDSFMSAEFQESLEESPLARLSKDVHYHDIITIQHKATGALLHSHEAVYPLRYEDGRISSNTQQVTCVINEDGKEDDLNNQWEILPASDEPKHGQKVFTNDVIRLRHIGTLGILLTHDVASPLRPTNEEFTIVYGDEAAERFNETLFRLRFLDGTSPSTKQKLVRTKATNFRLIHVDTTVAMWTHDDELLPDWGFEHQEVSGNKKIQDVDNVWTFETIVNLPADDPRNDYTPKIIRRIPFLKKWWELQFLMFYHNNILSSEHPFASLPESWPLALSGVSFWNDNDEKKQVFFTGNVIGFWIEVCFLAIYCGLILADQVTRRRHVYILTRQARSRLYNSLGFLFLGWIAHYFPFYLMSRQKFLHHYLPAHLIAALFTGGLVEFICSNNSNLDNRRLKGVHITKLIIMVSALLIPVIWFFFYFRPIIYGDVSLPPQEVVKRQWLDIKLHYSK